MFLFKTSVLKQSYKDLQVYKESFELYLDIHRLSIQLPKFEQYELGSQIRRSSDSVVSNIVEGYGRRRYKREFIRFLIFSHASCLETACHLEKISILYPALKEAIQHMLKKNDLLGKKIYKFIAYVSDCWSEE